jgi:DNA-directed RNA polymerase alpha subunit
MLERKLPKLLLRSTEHAKQSMLDCNGSTESEQESLACRASAEGEGEMNRRIIQPWTPSDDESLRKLAAEGRSWTTIAERLKRTRSSVRSRAKILRAMKVTDVKRRSTELTPSAGEIGLPDDTPLERVQLSSRIQNAMKIGGLRTVGEVRAATDVLLLSFQNVGWMSVRQNS